MIIPADALRARGRAGRLRGARRQRSGEGGRINILEVRAFGSFGRVYLGGEERDIDVGWRAAVKALEDLEGREDKKGQEGLTHSRRERTWPKRVGMIETRGFAAMVEAADAMVKAAKVESGSYEKIGGGYVTAIVRGDVAAVKAARRSRRARPPRRSGEVVTAHVIARPHNNIDAALPLGRQDGAGEE
jgi:ethanolamine utilization microcompartment shell protein EutS